MRESSVTSTKGPSPDTDRKSRTPNVTDQKMHGSRADPVPDSNAQSSATDEIHTSTDGEDPDVPLPSTETGEELDIDATIKYDEIGDAASQRSRDVNRLVDRGSIY